MGFSILARNGLCSLMICWLLLVPAGVPVLVSILLSSFFPHERGVCSIMICWFLLVLAGVPVLVSLLLSSFFPQERGVCSIIICWFLLVLAGVPVLVSLILSSLVPVLVSLLLSSFFPQERGVCSIMICWFLLVLAGVPVLVSLILSSLVPVLVSLLLSSFFPQERGVCSIMICWFLLVLAGVPVLVSLILSSLVFRCLSPFFSLLAFRRKWVLFHHDLSNRQPDGSLHILIDLFHGQVCLFSRKSHGLVLALLFSRDNRSNEGVKQKTGVCQTVPWILNCTWPWWKHALLLFGVYAGVIGVLSFQEVILFLVRHRSPMWVGSNKDGILKATCCAKSNLKPCPGFQVCKHT